MCLKTSPPIVRNYRDNERPEGGPHGACRRAQRWTESDLSDADAVALVQRAARKCAPGRVCWCGHGVCCPLHNKHVRPHLGCILR